MKAHFLTRDILLDYPQIGWVPPLPPGADGLWRQFLKGNFHCGDYPELLVTAKDGEWSLYLGAIPSTRTDAPGGGGRMIRTSCFLQGNASEAKLIRGVLSSYVMNVLLGKGHEVDGALASLLDAAIREGMPQKWMRMQFKEQEGVADSLMEKMLEVRPAFTVEISRSDPRDIPFSPSGAKDFVAECMALIAGKENGMAISLANLVPEERERAFSCIKVRPARLTVFYTAGGSASCDVRQDAAGENRAAVESRSERGRRSLIRAAALTLLAVAGFAGALSCGVVTSRNRGCPIKMSAGTVGSIGGFAVGVLAFGKLKKNKGGRHGD